MKVDSSQEGRQANSFCSHDNCITVITVPDQGRKDAAAETAMLTTTDGQNEEDRKRNRDGGCREAVKCRLI
jgi:hypothetical protein